MYPFVTVVLRLSFFFFFNDTATTEIYTLSLHDALPISIYFGIRAFEQHGTVVRATLADRDNIDTDDHVAILDRKSTRLNSSHSQISYAVFCLKKKKALKVIADVGVLNVAAHALSQFRVI